MDNKVLYFLLLIEKKMNCITMMKKGTIANASPV
ncbi:hypothetical protein EPIR_1657 [Erwinia piriflorinigrans CFBP 5888]|uniref:Uncharacterized protein n=1 Tax=Erwinia piriflorinigrans CFBP 5888 TaxID=1161919 RepID=V5Z7X9_9GAMM|nr:hypothetical protein EPIR_1657 [Erwinia piriflorinigrans CFBP 5888]